MATVDELNLTTFDVTDYTPPGHPYLMTYHHPPCTILAHQWARRMVALWRALQDTPWTQRELRVLPLGLSAEQLQDMYGIIPIAQLAVGQQWFLRRGCECLSVRVHWLDVSLRLVQLENMETHTFLAPEFIYTLCLRKTPWGDFRLHEQHPLQLSDLPTSSRLLPDMSPLAKAMLTNALPSACRTFPDVQCALQDCSKALDYWQVDPHFWLIPEAWLYFRAPLLTVWRQRDESKNDRNKHQDQFPFLSAVHYHLREYVQHLRHLRQGYGIATHLSWMQVVYGLINFCGPTYDALSYLLLASVPEHPDQESSDYGLNETMFWPHFLIFWLTSEPAFARLSASELRETILNFTYQYVPLFYEYDPDRALQLCFSPDLCYRLWQSNRSDGFWSLTRLEDDVANRNVKRRKVTVQCDLNPRTATQKTNVKPQVGLEMQREKIRIMITNCNADLVLRRTAHRHFAQCLLRYQQRWRWRHSFELFRMPYEELAYVATLPETTALSTTKFVVYDTWKRSFQRFLGQLGLRFHSRGLRNLASTLSRSWLASLVQQPSLQLSGATTTTSTTKRLGFRSGRRRVRSLDCEAFRRLWIRQAFCMFWQRSSTSTRIYARNWIYTLLLETPLLSYDSFLLPTVSFHQCAMRFLYGDEFVQSVSSLGRIPGSLDVPKASQNLWPLHIIIPFRQYRMNKVFRLLDPSLPDVWAQRKETNLWNHGFLERAFLAHPEFYSSVEPKVHTARTALTHLCDVDVSINRTRPSPENKESLPLESRATRLRLPHVSFGRTSCTHLSAPYEREHQTSLALAYLLLHHYVEVHSNPTNLPAFSYALRGLLRDFQDNDHIGYVTFGNEPLAIRCTQGQDAASVLQVAFQIFLNVVLDEEKSAGRTWFALTRSTLWFEGPGCLVRAHAEDHWQSAIRLARTRIEDFLTAFWFDDGIGAGSMNLPHTP